MIDACGVVTAKSRPRTHSTRQLGNKSSKVLALMSDIGPGLPPHLLAKRKRKQEEQAAVAASAASGAKRSASPQDDTKRRRVVGPSLPPAPLTERPTQDVRSQGSDDESDDGYGPVLPPADSDTQGDDVHSAKSKSAQATIPQASQKFKRDDWMMMPPKQDDLAARLDPTKIRARGFNTGKGAKGPGSSTEDNSAWSETPEQRQERLRNEMMGATKSVTTMSADVPAPGTKKKEGLDPDARALIVSSTSSVDMGALPHPCLLILFQEKSRGPSLMDKHSAGKGKDADDDPSKRAFDRDKDMGSGMRIGQGKRKEMLSKASDYSSKFAGGNYL